MTPLRVGQYGKRTPKNAPALDFAPLLTGVAPAHPDRVDYLAQFAAWDMLGNSTAGDCVAVTWANFRRLMNTLRASVDYPDQDQVWQVYRTQNPGFDPDGSSNTNGPGSPADQGMEVQTLLEYLQKTGGPDGVKVVCFGKVDPTDEDAVDAALAIFGGLWVGMTVKQENERQFAAGQPWDYSPDSPDVGGHSVLGGGYEAPGIKFITWATETEFTDMFRQHQVDELWVVVWPEHLGTRAFLEGIDQQKLADSFGQLTGRPFPIQPTPPAPQPVPSPPTPPVGVDQALAQVARHWVTRRWHRASETRDLRDTLTDWLDYHYPSNGGGGRHRHRSA